MELAIDVTNLSKRYGNDAPYVLDDVSFAIESGTKIGLIGPNGAGKSTLMKILAGVILPTQGSVFIHGHDIVKEPMAAKRAVRLVQQSTAFDMFLDGMAALKIAARFFGAPDPARNPWVSELLERFSLAEHMHKPTFMLSDGQLRKLQITRALQSPSSILILDEPTVGLDLASKLQLTGVLNQIVQENGTSLLLSSHILSEVESLCEDVLLLQDGHIVAHDHTRNLVQSHGERSVVLTFGTASDVDIATDALARIGVTAITIAPDQIQFWVGQAINPVDALAQLSGEGITISDVIVLPPNLEQAYAAITTRGGQA
ncbi:MAG: ABC transporter ATP-binding protein [Thermomicrobiales bacterium]|nr:ABC transporter ATP-binding protein [Thermomicrobiales bacterium]